MVYVVVRVVTQTQPRSTGKTKLTKELVELILDKVGECDANCLDYMYEIGKPLDFNVYGECLDNCVAEISRKLNVPIEKIYEIVREAKIEPIRWW